MPVPISGSGIAARLSGKLHADNPDALLATLLRSIQ